MTRRKVCHENVLLAGSVLCALLTAAPVDAATAEIEVLPAEEVGPVNRLVLGSSICGHKGMGRMAASWAPLYAHRGSGVWDPDGQQPEIEFVKAAREAGVTIWRQACDVGWKETVGPVEKRPHCQFGLPEFLAWCEATNAAPILIVPVYNLGWVKDAPRDPDFMAAYAADLVEYLNSPNDGKNPRDTPVPYRDTLGNALNVAEHIRVMMQPSNRVALATYWNFANEAWGMVRGFPHQEQPLLKQPPFYVFQLYNEHFGDTLIACRVSCDRWEFPSVAHSGTVKNPAQAVRDLTVNAAKRKDGALTLMIVNTNLDCDRATTIALAGWRPREESRAAAWSLVGTAPWATNRAPQPEVHVVATPIQKSADGYRITLPKYSLTAAELQP